MVPVSYFAIVLSMIVGVVAHAYGKDPAAMAGSFLIGAVYCAALIDIIARLSRSNRA